MPTPSTSCELPDQQQMAKEEYRVAARSARTAARPGQGRDGAQATGAESSGGTHPRTGAAVAGIAGGGRRSPTPHAAVRTRARTRRRPNWNDCSRKSARPKPNSQAAKSKLAKRPTSYAIVPYDGPNGTHRRPIYIECTAQGVILQPEGDRAGSHRISTDRWGPATRSMRRCAASANTTRRPARWVQRRTLPAADRAPRRRRGLRRRPTGHADVGRRIRI